MFSPRWSFLCAFLLTTTLLGSCYPVIGSRAALSHSDDLECPGRSTFLSYLIRRSSSPPRKRTRRVAALEAASSSHHHVPAHVSPPHTPPPRAVTPEGWKQPDTTILYAGPTSPGSHKIRNIRNHSKLKTIVKADDLKTVDYAKHAKDNLKASDDFWVGKEVDHVLEAQTVASKINKHVRANTVSNDCLKAIQVPMNHVDNLRPLAKSLNGEKNHRSNDFAKHDLYNHVMGPAARPNDHVHPSKHIRLFSPDLAEYHIQNKDRMLATADAVDAAMRSPACKELSETPLAKGGGGKVRAQALRILAHAEESAAHAAEKQRQRAANRNSASP